VQKKRGVPGEQPTAKMWGKYLGGEPKIAPEKTGAIEKKGRRGGDASLKGRAKNKVNGGRI